MNIFYKQVFFILITLVFAGCSGKGPAKKESVAEADTMQIPDTGFTGIKKYYSINRLIKEVTFKNGIRHGEMKSFYQGGQLYQTFWYENGLKEDSAKWYYLEGPVFRSTPFLHDTIHGTQIQYYRNGRVKAKLHYIKGLRTPELEEFTRDGKRIGNYPDISYRLTDNYAAAGRLRINLELTNQAIKTKFYRGEFYNGVFDTARVEPIKTTNGKAVLDLKKSNKPQRNHIGIIAEIITDFGNKLFVYKRIELPYGDLN